MKKLLLLLPAALMFGSGVAMAQTCASPLPITSEGGPHDVVSGDLCTAESSLPGYGGTPSPQSEIIYSFTAEGANASLALNYNGSSEGVVLLMPSPCSSATDPIALGAVGTPMVVSGLNEGEQYFVIVTTDPSGPADSCGTFDVSVTGTLPVSLQNVTVD